jgi:hypothetical protein
MESTASAASAASAASVSVLGLPSPTFYYILWSLIDYIIKKEKKSLDYLHNINNSHLMSEKALLSHLTEHFIVQYGLRSIDDHIDNGQKIKQFGMIINKFYPQIKNKAIEEYFSECNNLKEMLNYVKEIFDLI